MMASSKGNAEVLSAFILGALAGGAGVAFFSFRQVQSEHYYGAQMAVAAQRATAANQADLIRAREVAAGAFRQARTSEEKARRANELIKRQAALAQSFHNEPQK
jgi:uncharacterized protein HemX